MFQPYSELGRMCGRSKNIYCDYHEAKGHATNSCMMLKYLIEKNVQRGHMMDFVKRKEIARMPPPPLHVATGHAQDNGFLPLTHIVDFIHERNFSSISG